MLMSATREQVCESASKKLAGALARLPGLRALIGLDGFVDEIIAVVDKRTDFESFDRVPTIGRLAEKIAAASGRSSNYELVVQRMKLGGNGPIMANALASVGLDVTYIGNLGFPVLHPVFEEFSKRAKVICIAEPGHTDALEFDDGKLMLGKITTLNEISWQTLLARIGLTKLKELAAGAALIGTVNWTMIPCMNDLWLHLREDVFKALPAPEGRGRRKLFVDLADPEKRTSQDIAVAMKLLTAFQLHVDVILGLNLKESCAILEVLGLAVPADAEAAIEPTAAAIRQKLGLACVVIHPRGGAAAATAAESASCIGPFVQQPKISTGAGDHFNAGFCLGRVLDFSLAESLCTGVGISGYYVRNAASPTGPQLAQFIAQMPPPQ